MSSYGYLVKNSGHECRKTDASNGRYKRQTCRLHVEAVDHVQDSWHGDEPLEDDGKVEADVESDHDDERFGDQHQQRIEDGDGGHLGKSFAAEGFGDGFLTAGARDSVAEDLAVVCFWHYDAEC